MSRIVHNPLVAGALGGLIVLAIGVAAVATGLVGAEKRTVVQSQIASPAARSTSEGLTVHDIYKKDAPGVVHISADIVQRSQSPFGLPEEQRGEATGSGFVIDDKGYVVTNAHVVEGGRNIKIGFKNGDKEKTVDAKLVGSDASSDVALLKVDVDKKDLKPLSLGDSKNVEVGDPVVAIGNPFSLDQTVTAGIVSALQRQLTAPNNFTINNVIQTDAAINPGNSGGPLLDSAGKVIGINSQIATAGSGGNIGIGFAVPSNTVKRIIGELRNGGEVTHAYLGITGVGISGRIAETLNLPTSKGVLIQAVTGPAKKAGLEGGDTQVSVGGEDLVLGGDVITKIDDKNVEAMEDVIGVVDSKKPGDTVTLTVRRSGKTKTVKVKLGKRPANADQSLQASPPGGNGQGGEGGPQIPGIP